MSLEHKWKKRRRRIGQYNEWPDRTISAHIKSIDKRLKEIFENKT